MENQNKSDIVIILSQILCFRFNKKAEKNLFEILNLIISSDRLASKLGKEILNKIFHDEKLTNELISSYTYKSQLKKSTYKIKTENLSNNSLIGYRCFKHLVPSGYLASIFDINKYDRTQYRKYKKRCERILISLNKYNDKHS